jgi:HEAT repeat protein
MCRLAILVVLSGGLLACGRGTVHVASVGVSAGLHAEALQSVGIDRAALTAAARGGLAAAGFRMGEGPRSYRARLEVVAVRKRLVEDGAALAEIAVELELSPTPDDGPGEHQSARAGRGGPVLETGVGSIRVPAGGSVEAWAKALESAVREASTGLAQALSEEAKPVEKLVRDLRAREPRIREQAIRVLGDRRARAAVPALIERLADPDPLLAERAAGALAQIRDPRAVGPLIDYSRRDDDAGRAARFARIIGDVGGSEARGYLLTLESGHLDPRVRAAAREALQDMAEREREQGPTRWSEQGTESRAADSGSRMER